MCVSCDVFSVYIGDPADPYNTAADEIKDEWMLLFSIKLIVMGQANYKIRLWFSGVVLERFLSGESIQYCLYGAGRISAGRTKIKLTCFTSVKRADLTETNGSVR